ncbi:coiled-coil domain-containing protein [Phaeobacter italicus]|uniref:hypothetical protein n=1 Tax=Phaeobacter italicus TaxID=481446 RepID=UPI001CD5FCF4|nr:hypothetical protein [Phaeobacter italicus]MCA0858895.1 hypothetical protein [Phaeobacter italicus]
MRTAEKPELQHDRTHNLTASHPYANSVQQPGADVLNPLASRSLFWRARYLEASPALCHIPLLFWLVETARPRIAVTLGVADAVPHFALCQAVDKLGLDSLCMGVEHAYDDGETQGDLTKQLDFNEENFAEFSQIVQDDPDKARFLPPESKIDLLLINRPVTQELVESLEADWLPHLSERSIIVVLQEKGASGYSAFFHRLSANGNSFTCDLESRATVLFHGPEQNDRLQRLANLKPGHTGYLAARNIFARLGELHSNAERLAFKNRESHIARRQRDEKAAELASVQAEVQNLSTQYNERSTLVATAQAEAFDLSQAAAKLEQQLQDSKAQHQQEKELLDKEISALKESLDAVQTECKKLQQQAAEHEQILNDRYGDISALGLELEAQKQKEDLLNQEISTLKESCSSAEAERQKLQRLAEEQEQALSERYNDIAVLGLEIEAKTEENRRLKEEIEALKGTLGETAHLRDMHARRVQDLENSTSWRVTAPLRKASLTFRPKQ